MLAELMKNLAGEAFITFKGDLTECDFSEIGEVAPSAEGEITKRIKWDDVGFIVLPLNQETIKPILKQILPNGRVVHKIEEIQIEKDGQLQFLSGDNFHNDCISVGPLVTVGMLDHLKSKGLIKSYVSNAEAKAKYPWLQA